MACVVALVHGASGRQGPCDAGAIDSQGPFGFGQTLEGYLRCKKHWNWRILEELFGMTDLPKCHIVHCAAMQLSLSSRAAPYHRFFPVAPRAVTRPVCILDDPTNGQPLSCFINIRHTSQQTLKPDRAMHARMARRTLPVVDSTACADDQCRATNQVTPLRRKRHESLPQFPEFVRSDLPRPRVPTPVRRPYVPTQIVSIRGNEGENQRR